MTNFKKNEDEWRGWTTDGTETLKRLDASELLFDKSAVIRPLTFIV